ncbi:MAG TPA: ribosomal-processing cysteine protease Prp [Ruminococcaceae bacterium]|nr:ribosomal-processing cysteine protease Prp [Oscillospiraceae bacterium]
MTRSKFFIRQGILVGFELRGHSGFGCFGRDIVCAAVSSAALMTANTITEIMGVPADIQEREGFLRVILTDSQANRCRDVLEGFRLHLTEMQKQYPHNIKVIYGGVTNA